MNRTVLHLVLVASAGLSGIVGAQQSEPPVPVNLENVPPHLRERIKAKANEGFTSLRRYLAHAPHVHGLRIENLVRWDEYEAMARARRDSKVADVGKKATK